jgi:hypothetical protein
MAGVTARVTMAAGAVLLCAGSTRCAHQPPVPARSQSSNSMPRSVECAPTPPKQRCAAYQDGGFVEAYVEFFYATPKELKLAFPWGVPPAPYIRDPPPTSVADVRRADEARQRLPWMSCFSITEQELEALGDALGLPVPPPDHGLSAQDVATIMEKMTGEPVAPSEVKLHARGPRLIRACDFPGSCGMIHQVPPTLVKRLAAENDAKALGERWLAAIIALGRNPYVSEDEGPDVRSDDPRNDVAVWSSIASDLIEFVKQNDCDARKLYVEVMFDC